MHTDRKTSAAAHVLPFEISAILTVSPLRVVSRLTNELLNPLAKKLLAALVPPFPSAVRLLGAVDGDVAGKVEGAVEVERMDWKGCKRDWASERSRTAERCCRDSV